MSEPKEIEFHDGRSDRRMKYVYPSSDSEWSGWLFYWHPHYRNWVSLRKATDQDIAAISQAVVQAHHSADPGDTQKKGERQMKTAPEGAVNPEMLSTGAVGDESSTIADPGDTQEGER